MKAGALLMTEGRLNKTLYFVFLCLLSIFITYAAKSLLISEDLYFRLFGDQLSYERVAEIIALNEKWEWVSYAIIPLYYLAKIFLVAVCIYIGSLLFGIDISFTKIFHAALLAEGIFLIPGIFRLGWFLFVQQDYTLSDIQFFYPLSVLNFFDPDSLEVWWIYPLQLLNVFEVLYLFMLAYGLYSMTTKSYLKILTLTASSYGVGLTIWVVSIMFLTVSFSA